MRSRGACTVAFAGAVAGLAMEEGCIWTREGARIGVAKEARADCTTRRMPAQRCDASVTARSAARRSSAFESKYTDRSVYSQLLMMWVNSYAVYRASRTVFVPISVNSPCTMFGRVYTISVGRKQGSTQKAASQSNKNQSQSIRCKPGKTVRSPWHRPKEIRFEAHRYRSAGLLSQGC